MLRKYKHPMSGAELQLSDVDQMSQNAAEVEDYVFQEFLRLPPGSTIPARGILTYGTRGYRPPGAATPDSTALLSGNTSDGKLRIAPIRAFVASTIPYGIEPPPSNKDNRLENLRGLKSALLYGATKPHTELQLNANPDANPRWTMVYLALTPGAYEAEVERMVRPQDGGPLKKLPFHVVYYAAVQAATLDGTPAAQPSRPSVPSDAAGTFYILLGYVYLPGGWNPTQAIQRQWIHECPEVLTINSAHGVTQSRPASQIWKPDGTVDANEKGSVSAYRPSTYLPSTMVGGEEVWIPIDFNRNTMLDGQIVDDATDWRHRFCEWIVYFRVGGGDDNRFAFDRAATGNRPALSVVSAIVNNVPYFNAHGSTLAYGVGQTFRDDTGAVTGFAPAVADGQGIAVYVDGTMLNQMNPGAPDPGNAFFIYCDKQGALRLKRKGTLPGRVFVRLKASAPYANFGVL